MPPKRKAPAENGGVGAADARPAKRGKRAKVPKKRNLEDLWQAAFPVGTEWDNMEKIREINWSFSNLENAFEKADEKADKKDEAEEKADEKDEADEKDHEKDEADEKADKKDEAEEKADKKDEAEEKANKEDEVDEKDHAKDEADEKADKKGEAEEKANKKDKADEKAAKKDGVLYGKTVYLFGSTEAQLLAVKGEKKVVLIPIVVAVVSPIPPSDKIGVKSVQRETEDIIPMKAMKMDWVPYIPLKERQSRVDKLKTQIFSLGCYQRRSALKNLRIERIKQYDYCLPYLQPLKADEVEEETTVDIMYPLEPPVVCEFDWELDDIEEFIEELIKEAALPEDHKDAFKEYVKEQVRASTKAKLEVREARKKAIDDMNPETKVALENMRFYKFYPVQTTDIPDITEVKVAYINRYYGKAHEIF